MAGYNIQGAVDSLALNVGRTGAVVAGVSKQANDKKIADQKMLEQVTLQNETNTRLGKQQENLEALNRLQMMKDLSTDIVRTRSDELDLENDEKYYDELFEGESDYDKLSVMASDNKFKMLSSRRRSIEAQQRFNKAREDYVEFGTLDPTSMERKKSSESKLKDLKIKREERRAMKQAEEEANE